jgi:hypothetical protein
MLHCYLHQTRNHFGPDDTLHTDLAQYLRIPRFTAHRSPDGSHSPANLQGGGGGTPPCFNCDMCIYIGIQASCSQPDSWFFFLPRNMYCLWHVAVDFKERANSFLTPHLKLCVEITSFYADVSSQISSKNSYFASEFVYTSYSRFSPTFCLVFNNLVYFPFNGKG